MKVLRRRPWEGRGLWPPERREYGPEDREWQQEERECRESIRAEPDWNDIQASKAWLEERYPLLDDVSFGSPMFRYAKACVRDRDHMRGSMPITLASLLCFDEMLRFGIETGFNLTFDHKQEKMYPDYGRPKQEHVQEPNWSDKVASRAWLEQLHPLGPIPLGSPFFRYMIACRESRWLRSGQTQDPGLDLGFMLSDNEWERFCYAFPKSYRHYDPDKPYPTVLYPEYDKTTWAVQGPNGQATDRSEGSPGWPHGPAPSANRPISSSSYPSNPKRESHSSSSSHKRKSGEGDDAPPAYPANKRRRNPSDLSGGAVMSAEPLNYYEAAHAGLKQENNTIPMPPPRRQHEPAGIKSPTNVPRAEPSRKRGITDLEDAQPASSPSKKRRASSDTSGDGPLTSSPPTEKPLVDSSRKRSIEDVEDALSSASSPKRRRTPRTLGGHVSPPSSAFDPPALSTPTLSQTRTENGTRGEVPDPAPLHQKSPPYENPTTVILRANDIEAPALSQSDTTDGARNPEATNTGDRPAANPGDHDASLNGGRETQEPANDGSVPPAPESESEDHTNVKEDPDGLNGGRERREPVNDGPVPPAAKSQGERHVHIKEDPDAEIDSGHPRDQTNAHVTQDSGNRAEQTAISVVIPLQTTQRQPAANQELSPDEDIRNVPVVQNKSKRGRKPGTKGRKAPESEPQRERGKRKGRKDRRSNRDRDQQAYVGRLRSGVGERKHRKASKYFMPTYSSLSSRLTPG